METDQAWLTAQQEGRKLLRYWNVSQFKKKEAFTVIFCLILDIGKLPYYTQGPVTVADDRAVPDNDFSHDFLQGSTQYIEWIVPS